MIPSGPFPPAVTGPGIVSFMYPIQSRWSLFTFTSIFLPPLEETARPRSVELHPASTAGGAIIFTSEGASKPPFYIPNVLMDIFP